MFMDIPQLLLMLHAVAVYYIINEDVIRLGAGVAAGSSDEIDDFRMLQACCVRGGEVIEEEF